MGMPFCICLPNFVVIGRSSAVLLRHVHFLKMAAGIHIRFDLGNVRPPTQCNCRVFKFGLDPIYSFRDIAILYFAILA